jgi:hypothetical protein
MNQAEVMDMNAKARAKKDYVMDHLEVHPEKDKKGNPVKGGGHTVHTVMREKGERYGSERRAEKPFGKGQHEEMLAHVANELKLPEPGGADEADESEGGESKGGATAAAH